MEVDTISDDSILGGSRKLLCQRGRTIVSDLQAKMYMNDTLDSTSTTIPDEVNHETNVSCLSSDTMSGSFVIATDHPRTQEDRRRFIIENNKKWAQAEEVQGGPYNHFKERREFKPQFSNDCDDDIGSENLAPNDVADPTSERELPVEDNASPGPSSSQGRFGQGCSTPQRINNTLAPLRQWEVSAVVSLDQTVDKDNVLREIASSVVEKLPPVRPATFLKPSQKVKTGCAPPSRKADDSMSDVIASFSTRPKQVKSTVDKVSIPQPSVSSDNSESSSSPTFVVPDTVYNSAVDIPEDGTFEVQNNETLNIKEDSNKTADGTFVVQNNDTFNVKEDLNKTADGTFVVQNNNETLEAKNHINKYADSESICTTASTFVLPKKVDISAVDSSENCTFVKQNNETIDVSKESIEHVDSKNIDSSTKPVGKVKLGDRNNRDWKSAQMSSHSNQSTSILVDMSVGMDSPGSIIFATRPSKRNCNSSTPSHMRNPSAGITVDQSINMSEVSQAASIMDVDDSMIDPITDPRSISVSPTTPTRSLQHKPRSLLKIPQTSVQERQHTPARPGYLQPTVSSINKRMSAGRCSFGRTSFSILQDNDSPILNIDPSRLIEHNIMSGARPRVTKIRKNSHLTRNFFADASDINDWRRETLNSREKANGSSITKTEMNASITKTEQPKENTSFISNQVPAVWYPKFIIYFLPIHDENVDRQLALSTGSLSLDDTDRRVTDIPGMPVFDDFDAEDLPDNQDSMELNEPPQAQQHRNLMLLSESICSQSSPRAELRTSEYRVVTSSKPKITYDYTDADDTLVDITASQTFKPAAEMYILKPVELIQPEQSHDGLRRSKRVRIPPVRRFMGEKPMYQASPSGNKHLIGVSKVTVDKKTSKWINSVKFLDDASHKRIMARKAKQRRELHKMQRMQRICNNIDDSDDSDD